MSELPPVSIVHRHISGYLEISAFGCSIEEDASGPFLLKWIPFSSEKDGVSTLIADPPLANSTTMHGSLVCKDRNFGLGVQPNWQEANSIKTNIGTK